MPKLIERRRIIGYESDLELAPRRHIERAIYKMFFVCSECGHEQSKDNRSCECCKAKFNGMTREEEMNWQMWSNKLSQKFADLEIPYDALLRALWNGDLRKYIE